MRCSHWDGTCSTVVGTCGALKTGHVLTYIRSHIGQGSEIYQDMPPYAINNGSCKGTYDERNYRGRATGNDFFAPCKSILSSVKVFRTSPVPKVNAVACPKSLLRDDAVLTSSETLTSDNGPEDERLFCTPHMWNVVIVHARAGSVMPLDMWHETSCSSNNHVHPC